MEFQNYTERSRGFIGSAQSLAQKHNHQQLTSWHLLKVLLNDREGIASRLIKDSGGKLELIIEAIESELGKLTKV